MKELRFTLIGDGSSDRAILNIIKWTLDQNFPEVPSTEKFADFGFLRNPPPINDVRSRIECARKYYPFDLLFYHRDAESSSKEILSKRKEEIHDVLQEGEKESIVCVVPIVMMEAWLLIDHTAIKKAAGNRNSRVDIALPSINRLENEKDPKKLLQQALINASGLKGRHLNNFNVQEAIHLVAEYITDYQKLRALSAFKVFERDLIAATQHILNNRQN